MRPLKAALVLLLLTLGGAPDLLGGRLAAVVSVAGVVPPARRAAELTLSANDQTLVPWGHQDLRYRIKSFQPGLHVDLYLALVPAGSHPGCIPPDAVFTAALSPFVADLALSDAQGVITSGSLPAHLNPLTMTMYAVLVPHGVSPADPTHWVSNLAALDLAMRSLSSGQLEILAARGNPQAYNIQFFHDRRQRIETWIYRGNGAGQVFQFINGRLLSSDEDHERTSVRASTPVTFYDPGRFEPATTPAQIRALLGDPDRVTSPKAGITVWVFTRNRMSVTVQHGVVRRIEAY